MLDAYAVASLIPHASFQHLLLSETKTRGALGLIEDSVDALKEDVTEDGEANTSVALDTAEARSAGVVGRSVVNVRARHNEDLATDVDVEGREVGGAGEDVATVGSAVLGARDLPVVGTDNASGEVEESGAGVGDRVANGAGGAGRGADAVAACVELPEAVAGRDWHVGDRSGVLGGVDVAKVVRTGGALLEVGGEERLGE